jgi:hypothetical protein
MFMEMLSADLLLLKWGMLMLLGAVRVSLLDEPTKGTTTTTRK